MCCCGCNALFQSLPLDVCTISYFLFNKLRFIFIRARSM